MILDICIYRKYNDNDKSYGRGMMKSTRSAAGSWMRQLSADPGPSADLSFRLFSCLALYYSHYQLRRFESLLQKRKQIIKNVRPRHLMFLIWMYSKKTALRCRFFASMGVTKNVTSCGWYMAFLAIWRLPNPRTGFQPRSNAVNPAQNWIRKTSPHVHDTRRTHRFFSAY